MPTTAAEQAERRNPFHAPEAPPPDPRHDLVEKQVEIKRQVKQLYGLASQLNSEIEKTNSTGVLSLQVLKKAEQIQKIAKQIQSLTRG